MDGWLLLNHVRMVEWIWTKFSTAIDYSVDKQVEGVDRSEVLFSIV